MRGREERAIKCVLCEHFSKRSSQLTFCNIKLVTIPKIWFVGEVYLVKVLKWYCFFNEFSSLIVHKYAVWCVRTLRNAHPVLIIMLWYVRRQSGVQFCRRLDFTSFFKASQEGISQLSPPYLMCFSQLIKFAAKFCTLQFIHYYCWALKQPNTIGFLLTLDLRVVGTFSNFCWIGKIICGKK